MEAKSKQSGAIFKGKLAEIFVRIGIAEPIEEVKENQEDVSTIKEKVVEKTKRTYQKKVK